MKKIIISIGLLFLASCNLRHNNISLHESHSKIVTNVEFAEVPLSKNAQEIASMRVSQRVTVTYQDGRVKKYPIGYHNLIKTGDKIGQEIFGRVTNADGKPFVEKDGSEYISQDPDGNSFVASGNDHYLITHMETVPGTVYKTKIDLKEGKLIAENTAAVDFKDTDGTLINCASSKTPWNTHLGGEEDFNLNSIFSDSDSSHYRSCAVTNGQISNRLVSGKRSYFCTYVSGMQGYLNDFTIDKSNGYNGEKFTPYNYGYTVEVGVSSDGSSSVAKHYVTGKYSPELGIVMPDKRTVYMSDDGNAKGFWKFVSDKKIEGFTENWKGTLYAAKVKQLSSEMGGSFDMSWIALGHASDNEVKKMIDKKLRLTNIFDIAKPLGLKSCPQNFKRIYEDSQVECLRLKTGMEQTAAFLESRKYAAYLGATMEFRKEEGLAYDPANNKLYVAITHIDGSMLDDFKQSESFNDIRLPENICGGVYQLDLDSQFNINHMQAIITGKTLKIGEQYADENYCSPETIANPDNLAFLGSDILLISEDSRFHLNNMSWAYNVKTKHKTRIASLPTGSEVTGVTNAIVGKQGFLFMTQQHPFQDQPRNAKEEKVHSKIFEQAKDDDFNAVIGYFEGIPIEVFGK